MDNLKHGIIAAVAAGAALAGAPAAAELYLGASIGQATLESSLDGAEYDNCSNWSSNYTCYDPDFEDSDTALKIYGGYMFNEYVGVEVTYYDLGSMSDGGLLYSYDGGESSNYNYDRSVEEEVDVTGLGLQLVGQYPVGPVDLFAKAGVFIYDLGGQQTVTQEYYYDNGEVYNSDSWTNDFGDEGNDWVYGVGATWNVNDFGIRAEWEAFDLKHPSVDDFYMWSIGVEYRIK
jgi:OmpA-OmpF porin, OOP family